MDSSGTKPSRRGALALGELVGRVIDPVTRQRGFAATELLAAWPEIVGPRYADCTRPERIVWPQGEEAEGTPALLVLRVDGPRAILVQHEAGQIVERINGFLGYAAIGRVRLIQGPVRQAKRAVAPPSPELDPAAEARLAGALAEMPDGALRASLAELGRRVIGAASRPLDAAKKRHI